MVKNGWFSESARHALASKGIKTNNKRRSLKERLAFKRKELGYPLKNIYGRSIAVGSLGAVYGGGISMLSGLPIGAGTAGGALVIAGAGAGAGVGVGVGTLSAIAQAKEFVKIRNKIAEKGFNIPYKKLDRSNKEIVLKQALEQWNKKYSVALDYHPKKNEGKGQLTLK